MKIHRIFCYGTLKKGQYFHEKYLGGDKSKFKGTAKAGLEYSMYNDGLPHLVREATDEAVKGELYLIDEDVLKSLDRLEAHPLVYRREIIEVFNVEGDKKLAWAYLRPNNFKGKSSAYKETEFT